MTTPPNTDTASTTTTADSWHRIDAWLKANAPKIQSNLNPPATDDQLRQVERAIGLGMPRDWWDLYKVHNGMNAHGNRGSLFHGMHFLTLDETISEHALSNKMGTDPLPVRGSNPGINTRDMHNPKWIPFAHTGRTLLRIDMDPKSSGKAGQVIFTDHDDDTVIVLAGSVREFLVGFADDLAARKYFLNEEARREGNEFLDCVGEIDVVNWSKSPRWKHLAP